MDVGFSDSQLELRASVRDVLAQECPPAVLREAAADPERWRSLWKTVSDLGWPALAAVDAEAGLGVIELVAVLEECGYAAAPIPFLSSAGWAAGALRGTDAPVVAELAEGLVGTLGVGAPGDRRPVPSLRLADGRVQGTTGPVAEAGRAEVLVLLAQDSGGDTHVVVVRPGPGVEAQPMEAVDPTRPLAEVRVDVAPEATYPVDLGSALSLPLTAAAAELVGVTARLLDLAVAHATTREQFG